MKKAGISIIALVAILFTALSMNGHKSKAADNLDEWQLCKAYLNERNVTADFRHFSLRFPGSSLCLANLDFTLYGNYYEINALSDYNATGDTLHFSSDRPKLDFKFVRRGNRLVLNDPSRGLYLELQR